jgi:hypothetical protein
LICNNDVFDHDLRIDSRADMLLDFRQAAIEQDPVLRIVLSGAENEPSAASLDAFHGLDHGKGSFGHCIPALVNLNVARIVVDFFGTIFQRTVGEFQQLRKLKERMRCQVVPDFKALAIELLVELRGVGFDPAFRN